MLRTVQKTGCPICAGKVVIPGENDLASQYPEVAQEWDTEKNGTLTPQQVTASSNRKAWWRCRLGHSYVAGDCVPHPEEVPAVPTA